MRTLLLYLLLVGVPVVGVLAVLHVGGRLSAPRSVAGRWEVRSEGAAAGACPWTQPPAQMRIEQSGERLAVFGRGWQLRGRLQTDSLRAERGGDGPCEALVMEARLEGGEVAEALAGRFEAPGCAACPAVPFRAERLRAEG